MPPLVSVVLPFFHDEATVRDAVESVLIQTWADLELIAVDDGSQDRSAGIVAELARSDDRIELVHQVNAGPAAARNAAVRVARGRFSAFLDADDLWLPAKLERQLPLLDAQTLVFSDAWVEENGRRYAWGPSMTPPRHDGYPRGDVYRELVAGNFIATPSVMLPTALLREVGGFDENMRWLSDWDLWLRLAIEGVSFDYVPEPLAIIRVRSASLSRNRVAQLTAEARMFALHGRRASGVTRGLLRRRAKTARKELEVQLRKRAWRSALSEHMEAARRDLVRSLRVRPHSLRAWLALVLTLCPPLLRRVVRGRV